MSPVHGNQGQPFGRPAAPSQSNNQWGQPAQGGNAGYGAGGYPQGAQPHGQAAGQGHPAGQSPALAGQYGYPAQHQPAQSPSYGTTGGYGGQPEYTYPPQVPANAGSVQGGQRAGASYAPQFEPFTPAPIRQQPQPAYGQAPQAAPQGYAPQGYAPQGYAGQGYEQPHAHQQQTAPPSWGGPQAHAQPQADPRGFDLGTYMPQGGHQGYAAAEPQFANPPMQANEWTHGGHEGYGAEPAGYAPDHQGQQPGHMDYGSEFGPADGNNDMGFGQAAGGELDQGYLDDEGQDYEPEAPSRFRRPMMIAAVLAGAIVMGGGMTYGYKALFGGPSGGEPPVVKSAAAPAKVKPQDGGGKQFAHTDSKIMGRLGDGSVAAADGDNGSDMDANGTRKVSTLIVGRDGSIQAPSTESTSEQQPEPRSAAVTVPGLTVVDGLGTSRPPVSAPVVNEASAKAAGTAKAVVAQAEQTIETAAEPVRKIAKAAVQEPATGSIDEAAQEAPAPVTKPKKNKTAAIVPPPSNATSTSVATTGSGFVAVLASVPRSNSSRMDALKRFADMQQKYAGVLSGKTPDVAEANLGAKGSYHRLVVGPPGSREQASSVCSQLKTQGYADCWVTSY